IMRGIRHHANVDAVLVVGLEEVLEHHGAAALAPLRPVLAVQGTEIVGCLFRSIDVRVPVDDHGCFRHRYGHCERKAGPGQRRDQARATADRAGSAPARSNAPRGMRRTCRFSPPTACVRGRRRLARGQSPKPSPSASAMTRKTSVLSIWPRTRSLPGPTAVRTTSSPECTSALIIAGRLPKRSTAPGTVLQ